MNKTAIARFQVEGFHNWPDAKGERDYLVNRHRHLFYVEASIELFHNEREIEFHDFLAFCKTEFLGGEMGSKSCETMASELVIEIENKWSNRKVSVSIFEDNEVGASVSNY